MHKHIKIMSNMGRSLNIWTQKYRNSFNTHHLQHTHEQYYKMCSFQPTVTSHELLNFMAQDFA